MTRRSLTLNICIGNRQIFQDTLVYVYVQCGIMSTDIIFRDAETPGVVYILPHGNAIDVLSLKICDFLEPELITSSHGFHFV